MKEVEAILQDFECWRVISVPDAAILVREMRVLSQRVCDLENELQDADDNEGPCSV